MSNVLWPPGGAEPDRRSQYGPQSHPMDQFTRPGGNRHHSWLHGERWVLLYVNIHRKHKRSTTA